MIWGCKKAVQIRGTFAAGNPKLMHRIREHENKDDLRTVKQFTDTDPCNQQKQSTRSRG